MRLIGNLKHTESGIWVINHNNHDTHIHSKHNLWLIAHGKPGVELSFEIEEGVAILKANSESGKVR